MFRIRIRIIGGRLDLDPHGQMRFRIQEVKYRIRQRDGRIGTYRDTENGTGTVPVCLDIKNWNQTGRLSTVMFGYKEQTSGTDTAN